MRLIDADSLLERMKQQAGCDTCQHYNYVRCRACDWDYAMDIVDSEPEVKQKRESRAMLPCKCGGKRREHWVAPDSDAPEGLKCMRCGFMVWGKNGMDVIRKWNEAVKQP